MVLSKMELVTNFETVFSKKDFFQGFFYELVLIECASSRTHLVSHENLYKIFEFFLTYTRKTFLYNN